MNPGTELCQIPAMNKYRICAQFRVLQSMDLQCDWAASQDNPSYTASWTGIPGNIIQAECGFEGKEPRDIFVTSQLDLIPLMNIYGPNMYVSEGGRMCDRDKGTIS